MLTSIRVGSDCCTFVTSSILKVKSFIGTSLEKNGLCLFYVKIFLPSIIKLNSIERSDPRVTANHTPESIA